ncbi:MAG: hypothetical protein EDM03_06585 [Porphyrobacter sp. IPPAS B-1204]|nr:MAG: hypothetical protein EDM03_06585 [Porphyrobacter sp. IPPAS B-1204]
MPKLLLPLIDEANPEWIQDRDNQLSIEYWKPDFEVSKKSHPYDLFIVRLEEDRDHFADYMQSPYGPGALVISGRFKKLIEQFEPQRHHFWRVEVRGCSGEAMETDLYAFRPGNFVEGLIVEQSDARATRFPSLIHPIGMTPRLMWDSRAVSGLHVWCDRRMAGKYVFSDEIFDEVVRQDLSGYVAMESRAM